MRCNDTIFIDFVSRCLDWDPKKRMTPEEAVRHEWLQPSASSSYMHAKAMRDRLQQENIDHLSSQKYQRSHPLTPNTILPEIKGSSTTRSSQKTSRERAKGWFWKNSKIE